MKAWASVLTNQVTGGPQEIWVSFCEGPQPGCFNGAQKGKTGPWDKPLPSGSRVLFIGEISQKNALISGQTFWSVQARGNQPFGG